MLEQTSNQAHVGIVSLGLVDQESDSDVSDDNDTVIEIMEPGKKKKKQRQEKQKQKNRSKSKARVRGDSIFDSETEEDEYRRGEEPDRKV